MPAFMKRVTFNPEITLGHLIQAFIGLCIVLSLWHNMDKRVTLVEYKQTTSEEALKLATINNSKILTLMEKLGNR